MCARLHARLHAAILQCDASHTRWTRDSRSGRARSKFPRRNPPSVPALTTFAIRDWLRTSFTSSNYPGLPLEKRFAALAGRATGGRRQLGSCHPRKSTKELVSLAKLAEFESSNSKKVRLVFDILRNGTNWRVWLCERAVLQRF